MAIINPRRNTSKSTPESEAATKIESENKTEDDLPQESKGVKVTSILIKKRTHLQPHTIRQLKLGFSVMIFGA